MKHSYEPSKYQQWVTMTGKVMKLSEMTESHIENCLLLLEIDLLKQSVIRLGYKHSKTLMNIIGRRVDDIQAKMMMFLKELRRRRNVKVKSKKI